MIERASPARGSNCLLCRPIQNMHLSPDPDFEEFALDCIRLSDQEKSPILRLSCSH
jgi:hypothetical protein